jgi:hypothetical protein
MKFHMVASRLTHLAVAAAIMVRADALPAQWVRTHEQFYLEAPHNWVFRDRYMAADRLFNAFDYGHAILYEKLWTRPTAPPSLLEETEYDRLTKGVLVRPPRVPLEEGAIEIAYVKLAPEAKQMFEWAHVLHRQVYDVLADERLDDARKDTEVARLIAYYKTRRDVAFSSRPKSMALMQEQPYSLAFRQKYPKFNGLIWAYHWLQVGLYEPLVVGSTVEERQKLVRATVARFWQQIENPPATMPHVMPMTAAVAPVFSARFPEAAIIFDNLHSMHDVISDILANPTVPRHRKRAEILLAARRFRDDTSFVMTTAAWRTMAQHMGLENMGGPAVGFLPALPAPTVSYGAVMTHDDRTGAMTGFKYGQAIGGEHAGHARTDTAAKPAVDPHAGHAMPDSARKPVVDTGKAGHARNDTTSASVGQHDAAMMELHMRMLSDPVIRGRMRADTAMTRMMRESIDAMPAEHRQHMAELLRDEADTGETRRMRIRVSKESPRPVTKQPAAAVKTKAAPAAKTKAPPPSKTKAKAPAPTKKPADPHAGHKPPP